MPGPDATIEQESGFDEACRGAVGDLRSSLLALFRALEADPTRPQEVARRFKLDKSLTWKVSRALRSEDALSAAAVLPGASGIGILLEAMRRGGAPAELLAQAREASDEYDRVVEIHTGDRETMRLILDGLTRDERALEANRRQAFRGNRGIWGIQCAVRVSANVVAPFEGDPTRLDLGAISGATGVRRLRPIPAWPLLSVSTHDDDGTVRSRLARTEPLGDPGDDGGGWMIRPHCSDRMPAVALRERAGRIRFELGDGPIGRTGEFDWFGGYVRRGLVSRYASPEDRYGQFEVGISLPSETLLADLFVHHSLVEALTPTILHFSRLPQDIVRDDPSQALPIDAVVHDLGRGASVATTLVDRYESLIDSCLARGGWNRADFHCLRVVYRYPPLLSTIALRYELPMAPTG